MANTTAAAATRGIAGAAGLDARAPRAGAVSPKLELVHAVDAPGVTHLTYRVVK
jgi:hypothetical protein